MPPLLLLQLHKMIYMYLSHCTFEICPFTVVKHMHHSVDLDYPTSLDLYFQLNFSDHFTAIEVTQLLFV